MDISLVQSLALFIFSLTFVGLATPLVRRLALRFGVVDRPSEAHKTHREPVPYLGGIAIVAGVIITTYGALFISGNAEFVALVSTVLIPAVFMGAVGLVDDVKKAFTMAPICCTKFGRFSDYDCINLYGYFRKPFRKSNSRHPHKRHLDCRNYKLDKFL